MSASVGKVKFVSQPLSNQEIRCNLQKLHEIFQGGFHILSTGGVGGSANVAFSPSRLLGWARQDDAVCCMIARSVQQLSTEIGDGSVALCMGKLTTKLVLTFGDLDNIPGHIKSAILSHFSMLLTEHLSSAALHCCHIPLDMSRTDMLLELTRSVLQGWPIYSHSAWQNSEICRNLLKTFLMCKHIPAEAGVSETFGDMERRIHILGVEDSVNQTSVYSGLLVSSTGLVPRGRACIMRLAALQRWLSARERLVMAGKSLKVALVSASLAADAQDLQDKLTVHVMGKEAQASSRTIENAVVQHLLNWAKDMQKSGANVVLCQKCIHPQVKGYLLEQGVLTIDRLGAERFSLAQQLTSGQVMTDTEQHVLSEDLGQLTDVSHITLDHKGYWHLQREDIESRTSPVATFVLVASSDMILSSMRSACLAVFHELDTVFDNRYLVHNGGCFEWHIIHFLLKTVPEVTEDVLAELGCCKSHFSLCLNAVLKSLFDLVLSYKLPGQAVAYCATHSNHVFFIDSQPTSDSAGKCVQCSCSSLWSKLVDLLVVDSTTELFPLQSTRNAHKAQANGTLDMVSPLSSLETPEICLGTQSGNSQSPSISRTVSSSGNSRSKRWSSLSGKSSMIQASMDIAAAVVRIGTLIQESPG